MFSNFAYGLRIHSDIPLFDQKSSHLPKINPTQIPDVSIHLRQLTNRETEGIDYGNRCLGYLTDGVGKFLAEQGQKVILEAAPEMEAAILAPCILGPIFSVLLRQRGLFALHASGVSINSEAVAFMGHSGWGKSTLANYFYRAGYSVLTDDVMPIQIHEHHSSVIPAFPQIRLLPDAAASLGYEFEQLSEIHSQTPKRNNQVSEGFLTSPQPLKRIYLLAFGEQNKIEVLSPQEAFIELVRHSRAVNLLIHPEFKKAHLQQCARLIHQVSVCRLTRQRSLSVLPELVKLIEEDLAGTYRQTCISSISHSNSERKF